MTRRKRIGALLLCVGLVLVLAVSAAFVAHEADHDCSGEDCPICLIIANTIRLLRMPGLAAAALLSLFLLSGSSARCRLNRPAGFFSGTLVSWKIRLND